VFGRQELECSLFQALFVSKAVERVLKSDNTVSRFEVEESVNEESLEDLRALLEGKSITISEKNRLSLQRIAESLENEELMNKCVEVVVSEISVENCVEKLKIKEEFGCSIEEELEFVATHFYEVDVEQLKELKQETIEAIVSHERLCLSSEESLLDFISGLGDECLNLYGYVECCFLSLEGIELFLERIDRRELDQRSWNSICRRLRCELRDRNRSSSRFSAVSYPYAEGHEFEGIIHDLTAKCGGNVHEKGVVNITASSYGETAHKVVNYGSHEAWAAVAPNPWICFDFKEQCVALSHYTLKTSTADDYPLTWAMEGSNDGTNWTIVDERSTQDLNGASRVKTFECSQSRSSEFFRYLRLRHIGNNSSNRERLEFMHMEIFGSLNR
jgi:hypothetical protein